MRKPGLRSGASALFAALCLFVAASQAHAQVDVTPTVSFANGVYSYNYSVANSSAEDLALVNINVTPGLFTIQNLLTPAGFQSVYDTNLGIVTFLSDANVFGAGTTLDGFTFDSPYAPSATMFDALSLNGTPFVGTTQGPVVPEPGSLALLVGLGVTGIVALRRRK
jgi:hypothetical protein